ncbi:MAG: hypothetical protein AAF533_00515, partial [Acidobacteriota bacterium]
MLLARVAWALDFEQPPPLEARVGTLFQIDGTAQEVIELFVQSLSLMLLMQWFRPIFTHSYHNDCTISRVDWKADVDVI